MTLIPSVPLFFLVLLMPLAALAQPPNLGVDVEPAQPTEDDDVTLVVSGIAGCPYLADFERRGETVTVALATGCPLRPVLKPEPFSFEVHLGRLEPGVYEVRVVDLSGVPRFRRSLTVATVSRPITFSPPAPGARDPVTVSVTLEGLALCNLLRGTEVRGHMIFIDYDERCLAPPTATEPPPTVSFETTLEPLGATFYRAHLRDSTAAIVATADLVVQPADRCVSGDDRLCLHRGRFRAEVSWRLEDGSRGKGQAVPIGSDSGHFWFFRPDNVELVVKVLDACRPPYNTFWVFAAGLTDLEATLTVTDLRSGQTRRYHNPGGRSFAPVLDTRAFSTCP